MAANRQHALRRTASASMVGSETNIFEGSPLLKYPSEKEYPVLASYCLKGVLASANQPVDHNPMQPSSSSSSKSNGKADAISLTQSDRESPSRAFPLLQKFSRPSSTLSSSWNRGQIKSVGLGMVAAFADESRAMTEVKDGYKDKAPPHVVSKNSIIQPFSSYFPHHSVLSQGRSAVFLHELPREQEYNAISSVALPAADFLEACYLCKRRLSHGFDIYMYRGDQAFCSEECRYEQIVLDERKEKCSLQAVKMKTSASSFGSTDQRTQRMTSRTVAAG